MQKWEFEHAIECSVSIQFAWDFWTNVRNWVLDADVDSIEIQGEFAAGTFGVTHSKSSGRIDTLAPSAQAADGTSGRLSRA